MAAYHAGANIRVRSRRPARVLSRKGFHGRDTGIGASAVSLLHHPVASPEGGGLGQGASVAALKTPRIWSEPSQRPPSFLQAVVARLADGAVRARAIGRARVGKGCVSTCRFR